MGNSIKKWLAVCLLLSTAQGCSLLLPDTEKPPPSLKQSAETAVVRMYAMLEGSSSKSAAVNRLSEILEPGVHIYHPCGPVAHPPCHRNSEWRVNVSQSRWHASVRPSHRAVREATIYELWVVSFAGQGPWHSRLRSHHYYLGTEADAETATRRIVFRSREIPGKPDVDTFDIIVLPDGRKLKLPLLSGIGQ